MGRPFGLDFGSVMTVGAALGVDSALLAELLPAAEAAIIHNLTDPEDGGD